MRYTIGCPKKKDRILHLIKVHDDLDILRDKDEIILMEADTLVDWIQIL